MQKSGLFVLLHIQPQHSVSLQVLRFSKEPTLNIDGHWCACYKDQCEQGGGHLKWEMMTFHVVAK